MLVGLIAFGAIHRTECALAGNAALKLLSHFLRSSLFQRVGAAARDQRAGDHEQDRQAFHPLILERARRNASVVAASASA